MVSNLSDYLRDESVYAALEAMTEQFEADLVLFGFTGEWKHVRIGKVDFVNVGSLISNGELRYAMLEWKDTELRITFQSVTLG
jgi:hypothetical protein